MQTFYNKNEFPVFLENNNKNRFFKNISGQNNLTWNKFCISALVSHLSKHSILTWGKVTEIKAEF